MLVYQRVNVHELMVIPTTSPVFFVEPKPGDLSAMHSAKASSTPVFRSRFLGDFLSLVGEPSKEYERQLYNMAIHGDRL